MCNRSYPEPNSYLVPRKNVLVISCIDLRLTDDITRFLDHENLTNRYDQFILAGAALGAVLGEKKIAKDVKVMAGIHTCECSDGSKTTWSYWLQSLLDHVAIAHALHQIKDIYIIEHRNCGAFREFLHDGDYEHGHNKGDKEKKAHKKYATLLSEILVNYSVTEKWDYPVNVHAFLMDLRGNVELLHSTTEPEQR